MAWNRGKLYNPEYGTLAKEERQALLLVLPELDSRFAFVRFQRFERFGMATDTAVYSCDGEEFVFVPGGGVTLGWDKFVTGMDEKTKNEISAAMESFGGGPDLDQLLRESMSPVRALTVAPMLAARHLHDIGWRDVPLNSPELTPFQEDIRRHFDGTRQLEINGQMKIFQDGNGAVRAQIYDPISLKDFIVRLHSGGFALPTEDEWEYLCGGGKWTLFRWGDSFDFTMKLRHFERDYPKDMPYTLEQANQFGLSIAYDPYKQEVVESSEYFLKGGDGGCNICGGAGIVMGYLPVATSFRQVSLSDDSLNYQDDIGGDYTFYRRIVRL